MDGPVPALTDRAIVCAEHLLDAASVQVVSHIDADGLTSAAIAARMLERARLDHDVDFADQLDDPAIDRAVETPHETVVFTDFGSGQLPTLLERAEQAGVTPIVVDHHRPVDATALDEQGTETSGYADFATHLNPLLFGVDGASELSGAGTTYVLARALAELDESTTETSRSATDDTDAPPVGVDSEPPNHPSLRPTDPSLTGTTASPAPNNCDLAALAVVGAVGDMQAANGELVGANRAILEEGIAAGVIEAGTDLALFGRQTRPLPKLLEYAGDVDVPGVTGTEAGAIQFLEDVDIDLQADGTWRRWVDLTAEEKQTLTSALVRRAVTRGVPADRVERLVGTTYQLTTEAIGTELRDASEFSTLLNATARYDRADVGLAVCLGDRGNAYDRAQRLLQNHRRNLSAGIEFVEQQGVETAEYVQWFHAGDHIRDTIVGIVAGMSLGAEGIARDRPIVAFADKPEETIDRPATSETEVTEAETAPTGSPASPSTYSDEPDVADNSTRTDAVESVPAVKVSARATPELVRTGIDLSTAMNEAAAAVGGDGGGHDIAAGATIPAGAEDEFIAHVDTVIGNQRS